jgi:hypothetical protein
MDKRRETKGEDPFNDEYDMIDTQIDELMRVRGAWAKGFWGWVGAKQSRNGREGSNPGWMEQG